MATIVNLAQRIVAPGEHAPVPTKPAPQATPPLASKPRIQTPAASAAAGGPVVSRLAGDRRLQPVIGKFVARMQGQISLIEAAQAANDFAELASLGHWLKGAAGTVGFDAFTEPADELEEAANTHDAARCEARVAEIRDLAHRMALPTRRESADTAGVETLAGE